METLPNVPFGHDYRQEVVSAGDHVFVGSVGIGNQRRAVVDSINPHNQFQLTYLDTGETASVQGTSVIKIINGKEIWNTSQREPPPEVGDPPAYFGSNFGNKPG
jgi:hypothetical protein